MFKKTVAILLFMFLGICNETFDQNYVVNISADQFESFVENNDFVYVNFVMPNCENCENLSPMMARLADIMRARKKGIPITKTEVSSNHYLKDKYKLELFPSLFLFAFGNPILFRGNLEPTEVYAWIQKRIDIKPRELSEISEIKSIAESKIAVLLSLGMHNKKVFYDFRALSMAYERIPFYYTRIEDVQSWIGSSKSNHFIVFHDLNDEKMIIADDVGFTFEVMKGFLEKSQLMTIIDLNEETAQEIFTQEKPLVILFSDEVKNKILGVLKKAAQKFWESFQFVRSQISTGVGQRLSEHFGISIKDNNTVMLITQHGSRWDKYILDGPIMDHSINDFINNFQKGKLKKYYKSEGYPKIVDSFIKKVVGKNFNEIVLKPGKDVLLLIVASHCEECEKLEKLFENLAKKLWKVDSLVLGIVNSTLNEHEKLSPEIFPSIKLFKRHDKENPIDLAGQRNFKSVINFLQSNLDEQIESLDEIEDFDSL